MMVVFDNLQLNFGIKNSELFSLIVFHTGRLEQEQVTRHYIELASHGCVCSIDHTYQCFYTTTRWTSHFDGYLCLIS